MARKDVEEARRKAGELIEEKRKGTVEVAPRVRVSPTFVSSRGVTRTPQPSVTPAQATARASEEAREIRAVAKAEGVKPEVVLAKRQAEQRAVARRDERFVRRTGFGRRAVVEKRKLTIPTKVGKIEVTADEEKEVPQRTPTLKDVDISGSIFPKGTREESRARRKREGKITLPTFLELKAGQVSTKIEKRIGLDKLPTRNIRISVTELGKFGLFTPAFASTPEALGLAIRTGQITPVARTRFIARARPLKTGTIRTDIIAKAEVGGKKLTGLSTQVGTGTRVNIGTGKQFVIEPTRKGTIVTEVGFGGISKEIGTARVVKEIGKLKVSQDVGKVIAIRTGAREVGKAEISRRLRLPTTVVTKRKALETVKGIKTQDVIGIVSPTRKGTFEFVGAEVPTTTTKFRIPKTIAEPTITGEIGIGKFPTGERIVVIPTKKTIPLFPKGKRAELSTAIQARALADVGVLTKTIQPLVIKDLPKTISPVGILARPTIKTKTITVPAQIIRSKSLTVLKQPTRQKQLERLVLAQPSVSIQRTKQIAKQTPIQKQRLLLRTGQRLKLQTKQKTIPTIRISRPKPRIKGIVTPSIRIPRGKAITPRRATFGVSIRRRGKFRPIGAGLRLPRAISIGRERVGKTLAVTFKITPEKKGIQTGGFRTPRGFKRKKGLIFIEQPKLRLSTKGEIGEIIRARKIR
jgi:hypothetical protein